MKKSCIVSLIGDNIEPKYDENDNIIGFVAGRKIAYYKAVGAAEKLYVTYHGTEYINHPVFYDEGYDAYLKATV